MKTQKMNIMSKKNKKQNSELIEKLNEIQSQLNDVKSDAGIVVEDADIVFTRQQLEDFLVEYTNKVNEYIFDEMYGSLDTDNVVSFEVDGREITPTIDEDSLRDVLMEATANIDSDIMMEYAEEAMSEVGVI
jgi:seryl-tRNA synthetase